MKKLHLLVFVMVTLFFGTTMSYSQSKQSDWFEKKFKYKSLNNFELKIFNEFLDAQFPAGKKVEEILNEKASTRNTIRVAEALLFRNQQKDALDAFKIIKWLFTAQNLEEGSKNYGVWRGSGNTLDTNYDQNMREFIGTDLIIIYHKYKKIMPPDLVIEIENCLKNTAKGDLMRNVNPDYNNISIMSSFMLEYIGTTFNLPIYTNAGINKAKQIIENFKKYNTLCEYNTPTYYGVDFTGLALWRELSYAQEMKEMGKFLEYELWLDVAQFYNANLQNISGPYLRSYGMDMKKYTAIVGVFIATAVDDTLIATIPGKLGPHDESNFILPIFDLGLRMPKKALQQFKKFESPRFLTRTTPNYYEGDKLKKITAAIQENWMMGGLWGNRKVSGILKTGTMHWNNLNGDIGWMFVPGEGKTNVKVSETQMEIYLADSVATQFELLVYAPHTSVTDFKNVVWDLGPMKIEIQTPLKSSLTESMTQDAIKKTIESDIYFPYAYKLIFSIPTHWDAKEPLMILKPSYRLK